MTVTKPDMRNSHYHYHATAGMEHHVQLARVAGVGGMGQLWDRTLELPDLGAQHNLRYTFTCWTIHMENCSIW